MKREKAFNFISYSQNFEDVMLWRALKHIDKGFYVDVGASDPKIDSVTNAFYERGWRGINIEPVQSYHQRLCSERPEDINLPIAVGATEEELVFFEVPETGLSTVDPAIAHTRRSDGWTVIEQKVQTLTLNQVYSEYVHGPIHFLKIDVEGFEDRVLQGLDLSRWRPWIIIVEATVPNSTELNYLSWEPLILSAAYKFVYFDGLNRFYVANEHAELGQSFNAPPNVFDDFITVHQFNAIQEIERLVSLSQENQSLYLAVQNELDGKQKELETAKTEIEVLRFDFEWAQKELEAARNELDALRSELEWARTDIRYIRKEINIIRKELKRAQDESDSFRSKLKIVESEQESKQANLVKTKDELERAQIELRNALAELDAKRSEADNFRKEYLNIYFSRSYQMTAPLRTLFIFSQTQRERVRWLANRLLGNKVAASLPQESLFSFPEISEDEKHFLDLFQREIARRRRAKGKG